MYGTQRLIVVRKGSWWLRTVTFVLIAVLSARITVDLIKEDEPLTRRGEQIEAVETAKTKEEGAKQFVNLAPVDWDKVRTGSKERARRHFQKARDARLRREAGERSEGGDS